MGTEEILIMILLIALTIFLIIVYVYFKVQDRFTTKNKQIAELMKSVQELKAKLEQTNHRAAFRLDIPLTECTIHFLDFGDDKYENLLAKKGSGIIRDISIRGMKLECEYDLPVKLDIKLEISFTLMDESFSLKAVVIRKDAYYSHNRVTYGLEFIELRRADEHRLLLLIQNLEMSMKQKVN